MSSETDNLTRREFAKFAGLSAASLVFSGCVESQRQNKSQRPNIVFFIADDMHPEMFNCLQEGRGKNLTPNIDRLVAEGIVMTEQHVVSPLCTPSRYNCLTGRYASRAINSVFWNEQQKKTAKQLSIGIVSLQPTM